MKFFGFYKLEVKVWNGGEKLFFYDLIKINDIILYFFFYLEDFGMEVR